MELLVALIVLIVYFLPSIAGFEKRNRNAMFIWSQQFTLNLLLGWRVIEWIIAWLPAR